tara:strand:- start:310 stop:522 length:213 start_codon:yes stop_codon:yes gene_type:complete
MSKVKQYYWDQAEKQSDEIIMNFCQGKITHDDAKQQLSNVEGIELCDINEYNVDEVLDIELEEYNKRKAI